MLTLRTLTTGRDPKNPGGVGKRYCLILFWVQNWCCGRVSSRHCMCWWMSVSGFHGLHRCGGHRSLWWSCLLDSINWPLQSLMSAKQLHCSGPWIPFVIITVDCVVSYARTSPDTFAVSWGPYRWWGTLGWSLTQISFDWLLADHFPRRVWRTRQLIGSASTSTAFCFPFLYEGWLESFVTCVEGVGLEHWNLAYI